MSPRLRNDAAVRGLRRLVVTLGLPVLLLGAWWLVSAGSRDPFWPPLREVLAVSDETWLTGRLADDVLPSLGRLALGYAGALLLGVAGGVAVGSSPTLRAVCEPVLELLRAIPPPVLVPVMILLAGIGDLMKVLVILWGCVWPVLLNTVEGVRGLDPVLADTARCYRLRRGARLRRLVLPACGPRIATGARQALSLGIVLMVISEMFAASNGLGFTVVQFQRSFAIPQMWSGILLLGLLGVLLAAALRAVERRLLSWHQGVGEDLRSG